eukprot:1401929-Prymnesium_polylepis.1
MLQGVRFCAPFRICEHSKTYAQVQAASPDGFFRLAPSAAVRAAVDLIVGALGANFTGVHVRQGDRVGMPSGSGVPRMTAELLYASVATAMPPDASNPRPALLVCTDRPALLREGRWAVKLQLDYRLHTIGDFWPIVRTIDSAIPLQPSECAPYILAHLEKLILARAWRFIMTEVSTFDHHVRPLPRMMRIRAESQN